MLPLATFLEPIDPGPARWQFPWASEPDEQGLVATGADLEPPTLLAAYARGLFPMPIGRRLGWWSPDPRGVIPLDGLRVSRSLRKSCAHFEVTIDQDFGAVIEACRRIPRRGQWITPAIERAYVRLHQLGWAHSVEAWTPDGQLAGGLYGVSINGFFAGESMFHLVTDASKVALAGLVRWLRARGAALLDVQWQTEHLATLGAITLARHTYLERVAAAVEQPVSRPRLEDPAREPAALCGPGAGTEPPGPADLGQATSAARSAVADVAPDLDVVVRETASERAPSGDRSPLVLEIEVAPARIARLAPLLRWRGWNPLPAPTENPEETATRYVACVEGVDVRLELHTA